MPNATFTTMSLSRITVILSTITVITLSNRITSTTMPFIYSHHVHPLHSSTQPHRCIRAKTSKRTTTLPVSHPLYYSVRPHRHITNTNKQTNTSLCLAGTLRQRALWRAPKTLSHARHHQSGTLTLTSPWVRRWANEWRWHRTYGRASLSTPRCISTSIVPTSQRFCFADRAKLVFACSIAISARSKKVLYEMQQRQVATTARSTV